jgi:MFS superfamily sulfate permease-like transporter
VPVHDKIYLNIREVCLHVMEIQWIPFITAAIGILIIFILKKKKSKIPGTIIVSLLGIGVGYMVQQ